MKKTVIKQNPEKEVPAEILAESIVTVAEGMKRLRSSRLTDRALLLLIQDACKLNVGMREVKDIMDAIENLGTRYLKKKPQ